MQSSHLENRSIQNTSTLHDIIRTSKDIAEIKEFLSKFSHEEQVAMAHSVDTQGLLPLKAILETSLPLHQTAELCVLILSLTTEQTCLPLTSKIDDSHFQSLPDSPLRDNLILGVQIVNLVREDNLESITHPHKTLFTMEEKATLMKKLARLKKLEVELTIEMLLDSDEENFQKNTAGDVISIANNQLLEMLIILQGRLFKEKRIGNCYELAILGLYYCQKLKTSVNYEAFMSNGDHVFVVMGRDRNSHPNDYKTWGPNTIICDPWSALVCPASELENRLKDYEGLQIGLIKDGITRHYNILVNFNPHYHILTPLNITQRNVSILSSISFATTYGFIAAFNEAPLKTKVLFETTILKRVNNALKRKIISKQDIRALSNPLRTLLGVFRGKYGKYFLLYKLITLQKADKLPLETLSIFFNQDNFKRLLQSYGRDTFDPTLYSSDGREKKYKLHSLVALACKTGNPYLLEKYLFKYHANRIHWMAKNRDEYDKLPYEYISDKSEMVVRRHLHKLIWPYTHAKDYLPLTALINFIDVIDHTIPSDAKRNKYLKFAVELINLVRKEILQSSTHPTARGEELTNANEKIYFLREEVCEAKRDLYLTAFSEDSFSQHDQDIIMHIDEEMKWKLLELEVNRIKKTKAGNCGEMATLALYHGKLLNKHIPIERVGFTDASHTLVIIGRNPNSDLNNYHTWGDDTVVCDIWTGEAYPATQLELKLKCHRMLELAHNNKMCNVLVHYNPEFHTLKLYQQSSARKTNLSASLAFVDQFNLRADFEKLSLGQKYFFARHTLFCVEKSEKKGLITKTVITSLNQPFRTLFAFSNKKIRRLVKLGKMSLQEIDAFYSQKTGSEGIGCSSSLFSAPHSVSLKQQQNTANYKCG